MERYLAAAPMKKISVTFESKTYDGYWLADLKGGVWLHMSGRTWYHAPSSCAGGEVGASPAMDNQIVAPMPGKVLKVQIEVGEAAKAQEVAIVMEAMKMEYSLKFQREGVVESVSVKEGDMVARGEVLVTLKM